MSAAVRNPANYFIKKDVQDILVKLTGFDLKRIFRKGFNPQMRSSNIELLTQKQLDEENEKAMNKARNLLQMPPFLNPRKQTETILSVDEKLNPLNLKNTKYMFIDISMNTPDHKRTVVVRESNGVLRNASYSEREKMLQVYFPKEGKPNYIPIMFNPAILEEVLKLKNYMTILKKACLTFEPNDPEFIRVTHRVYEYINEHKEFDVLYSTRFYGPMVFYLVWYKKLNNLLSHYLNEAKINECVDVVRLYALVHEDALKSNQYLNSKLSDVELLKMFVKNEMTESASTELALTKYVDSLANQKKAQKN